MRDVLAIALAAIFACLAFAHVYWSLGGAAGKLAAIPHVSGTPAFRPSPLATFGIAMCLFICALLVLSVAGIGAFPAPRSSQIWLAYALALILFLRAVGDFRLVGFFKRVRGSRFAELDSLFFSPLCLALSLGVFVVVYNAGT